MGSWQLRRSGCGRVTKQKGIATLDRPEALRFKPSEGREQGQGPETSAKGTTPGTGWGRQLANDVCQVEAISTTDNTITVCSFAICTRLEACSSWIVQRCLFAWISCLWQRKQGASSLRSHSFKAAMQWNVQWGRGMPVYFLIAMLCQIKPQ